MNKIDKKQLHDSKVFEKAIKIIMSKSKKPKEDFLSIRKVYEEKPPEYPIFTFKPFADFKEERKPSYTLRYGGVGRWDDFNAWQRLAYVVNILQENHKQNQK